MLIFLTWRNSTTGTNASLCSTSLTNNSLIYLDKDAAAAEINISSAICFLRAKAYEALENRAQARLWYIAAVKADPLCYEALECLIEKHMLTCDEEATLLSSLQFGPEDGWLSSFYSCLTKKGFVKVPRKYETKFYLGVVAGASEALICGVPSLSISLKLKKDKSQENDFCLYRDSIFPMTNKLRISKE
ncbi:anaphase-promoting complex subunit 6-like [Quercus robur]|uniref:anaphase-promoting complex subunit 6-like n=1 Tax=Quercus robur TaxID=38942 RepID=UPI00216161D1|nr:anaphase-promoting complex subunit 6-like [Quercus robur]